MYKLESMELKNIGSHVNSKYVFNQGQVTVIVGENMDDSGQKGNGSGKSYIGEGIAIALLGEAIRKVKNKDVVNDSDGVKQGSVKLELSNNVLNHHMTIVRNFFVKGSAECYLWESYGDEESKEVELDSVASKDAWILRQLDISKNDLYDFFLITSAHYEAFLNITDTKKKVVVNRFSGADCIDQTEPLIKADIVTEDKAVGLIATNITRLETRIEIYQQDVEKIQLSNSAQHKQEQIKEIDSSIEAKMLLIEVCESEVEAKTQIKIFESKKLEKLKEERDIIQAEATRIQNKISEERKKLHKPNKGIEDAKLLYDLGVQQVNSRIESQKEINKGFDNDLKEAKEIKADLENQLAGTITCPKCSHRFVLRDKEFIVEDKEVSLQQVKDTIIEIEQDIVGGTQAIDGLNLEKQNLSDKFDNDTKALRKQIEDINTQLGVLNESFLNQSKSLSEKNAMISNTHNAISTLDNDIEIQNNKADQYCKDVESLNQNKTTILDTNNSTEEAAKVLKTAEAELFVLKQNLEQAEKKRAGVEAWIHNFKAFKSYLANQSIKNIEDYTNLFLQQIESNIQVQIEGYKTLSSNKLKEEIDVTILRNGFEAGSYGKFSGGERGRVDVCCILAIQELINRNSKSGGLDLLLCDEIIDNVDTYGLECIVKGLGNLQRTILLISQHNINSLAEQTIIVRKENKISTIIKNEV